MHKLRTKKMVTKPKSSSYIAKSEKSSVILLESQQFQKDASAELPSKSMHIVSRKPSIPKICQNALLSLEDNKETRDENLNWLGRSENHLPLWSRLYTMNSAGQIRNNANAKFFNYDIEIPNKLFSLWSNAEIKMNVKGSQLAMLSDKCIQTNKLSLPSDAKTFQNIGNFLICCAALKYSLDEWSPTLLDQILQHAYSTVHGISNDTASAAADLSHHELNPSFNLMKLQLNLNGFKFQVLKHKVTTGKIYVKALRGIQNLAHALMWFFRFYQFGIVECCDRQLAIGYAVDVENNFFMHDCQLSTGPPLFSPEHTNSYVLRTNHLQVLVYCILQTLNIRKMNVEFEIFNLDITMEEQQPEPVPVEPKNTMTTTTAANIRSTNRTRKTLSAKSYRSQKENRKN